MAGREQEASLRKTHTLALAAAATVILAYGVTAVFTPKADPTASRPNTVTAHEADHDAQLPELLVVALEDPPTVHLDPAPPAELTPAFAAPAYNKRTARPPVEAHRPSAVEEHRPSAVEEHRPSAPRPRRASPVRSASSPEFRVPHGMKSLRSGCIRFARMGGMDSTPCAMMAQVPPLPKAMRSPAAWKSMMASLPKLP